MGTGEREWWERVRSRTQSISWTCRIRLLSGLHESLLTMSLPGTWYPSVLTHLFIASKEPETHPVETPHKLYQWVYRGDPRSGNGCHHFVSKQTEYPQRKRRDRVKGSNGGVGGSSEGP